MDSIRNRARRERTIENLVKRIPNALQNPTSTCEKLLETMREINKNKILFTLTELNEWFRLGLEKRRFDLLLVVFFEDHEPWFTREDYYNRLFRTFIVSDIAKALQMLDINIHLSDGTLRCLSKHTRSKEHQILFAHPRLASVLLSLSSVNGYIQYRHLFKINKSLSEKRRLRWKLIRFWLHVKTLLPFWCERLYEPGVGSLYLRAKVRFDQNM